MTRIFSIKAVKLSTMKPHLTYCILRRMCYNALHQEPLWAAMPLSPRCLCLQAPLKFSSPPAITYQKRTIFNVFGKSKRKQKRAKYEPGYEVLLNLQEKLKMGVRPPPAKDVQEAFGEFTQAKAKTPKWLEDVQVEHMQTAFIYIKSEVGKGEWANDFSAEQISEVLSILARLRPYGDYSQPTLQFAKLLFEDVKTRYQANDEGLTKVLDREQRFQNDADTYIGLLATNGRALEALELTKQYSRGNLASLDPLMPLVVRGLIRDGKDKELEQEIQDLEARRIQLDPEMQEFILAHYAGHRRDLGQSKKWYYRPTSNGQKLGSGSRRALLGLCIHRDDYECGDAIAKQMVQEDSDDKKSLDAILRWAACKGRGVDEVERMMEIMMRRNQNRRHLHPDIDSINRLACLATTKYDDPYTAERYIAMGQKLGFQPDQGTHRIQMDYRIRNKDLSGAMVSYSAVRDLGLGNKDFVPLNRLIVAFCEHRSQNHDAIMSLVDDLSEQNGPFLPETVAALAKLHLSRYEMDDLQDLLNTYIPSFGSSDRELVCVAVVGYILDRSVGQIQAWESWDIARKTFPEIPLAVRVEVMKSFFDRNRPDMGAHVFGQMRHSHIKEQRPTTDTYAECLEGIARFGDSESLETIHSLFKVDTEVEPDTKVYNALMLAYSSCRDGQRALNFWDSIIRSQEGPTYSSIQIALQACEHTYDGTEAARKIWKKIQISEIEITREVYAAYLGALASHHHFDECVAMCKDAEKNGFSVDALLLGTFFNATRGHQNRQRVKEWARESYPEAYESLLKCGQYEVKRDPLGIDDFEGLPEREIYFNIGHLGRYAKP